MYVMLWRIDAGDYAGALEIGRHALRHGWVMPLGNRNVQTVLAEGNGRRRAERNACRHRL
ncbi:small terminase subunit [Escherichia coli]|nr:small terminase subunit [Escherichia coli]